MSDYISSALTHWLRERLGQMKTPSEMLDFADLFDLRKAPPIQAGVSTVKVFAPSWDGAQTDAFKPMMADIRKAVLTLSQIGITGFEIAEDIAMIWPDMPPVHISLQGNGTRVLLEVLE